MTYLAKEFQGKIRSKGKEQLFLNLINIAGAQGPAGVLWEPGLQGRVSVGQTNR